MGLFLRLSCLLVPTRLHLPQFLLPLEFLRINALEIPFHVFYRYRLALGVFVNVRAVLGGVDVETPLTSELPALLLTSWSCS